MGNMKSIENQYLEAENRINEIKQFLRNAKFTLENCYDGVATDLVSESIDRYVEHMEFLKLCCEATRAHIKYSRDAIYSADAMNSGRR